MTEQELKYAINEGLMENEIHRFVNADTIAAAGRKKDCKAVRKLAWKMYVASVVNLTPPQKERMRYQTIDPIVLESGDHSHLCKCAECSGNSLPPRN